MTLNPDRKTILKCPFCINHNGFHINQPMSVEGRDTATGIITALCSRCLDEHGQIGAYRYTRDTKTFYERKEDVPAL